MNWKNKGFTLVEMLIVLTITLILATIVITRGFKYIENSRKTVCEANRSQIMKSFEIEHIEMGSKELLDAGLNKWLIENDYGGVCPSGGVISFVEGEIHCSIHSSDNQDEEPDEEDDGSVPFIFNTKRLNE